MQKYCEPIDLSPFVGKRLRNRIIRVGVELEGGWKKLPKGVPALVHDGSVFHAQRPPQDIAHAGELPSPPKTPREMLDWMPANYPDYVDSSCGFHVHMSFANALEYQWLMEPPYGPTVVAEFSKWATSQKMAKNHPIWPRLEGKSEYCQHLYAAVDQARRRNKDHDHHAEGHRYTAIGYPWSRLGTIECRLLPMFKSSGEAIAAMEKLIEITNLFLLATGKREHHIPVNIADGDGPIREEIKIFV